MMTFSKWAFWQTPVTVEWKFFFRRERDVWPIARVLCALLIGAVIFTNSGIDLGDLSTRASADIFRAGRVVASPYYPARFACPRAIGSGHCRSDETESLHRGWC